MKKILIFGTYPIMNPQHGGQQRVSAILKAYRDAGFRAEYIGVFQKSFYPDHGPDDVVLPDPKHTRSLKEVYTADVSAGKQIYENPRARHHISEKIKAFEPDVIHCEQVFTYFGLRKILAELNWRGALVYGSQNIESQLKKVILDEVEIPESEKAASVEEIEAMEIELTKAAELVLACTVSDETYFKTQGAKSTVVAPNGINKRNPSSEAVAKYRTKYAKQGVDKLVLFIGSAHPPNLNGYVDMVGMGLGFLPANSRLIFAGGVADIVKQRLLNQPNYIQATFTMRGEFLGRMSEEDLGALIVLADTIILPITEGGGSNLKTAEAILAGCKIVATKHAFRSYEDYESLPNVTISDDRESFCRAVRAAVTGENIILTKAQTELSKQVTWDKILQAAIEGVGKL